MSIGPYRKTEKQRESEEIERQMEEFFKRDGHITVLETKQSEFRPTWKAYATASFEGRGEE